MQQQDSGGFDRRTLMAFALMILVLVISQRFIPSRQKPAQAPVGDTVEAVETPQTVSDPPPATPSSTATQDWQEPDPVGLVNVLPAEERTVEIPGERFTAVFTTRGATLASWKLHDYTDASEEIVDLVGEQPGALALKIAGPAGVLDFSETLFSLQESQGSGGERILRFVAETAPGDAGEPIRVERTYRIDPTRFDMEMDVHISGITNRRGEKRCMIEWARGIPNLETLKSMEKAGKAAVALLAENLVKDALGGGMGRPGCGCMGQGAKSGEHEHEGTVRWAGVRGKYFTGLLIPEQDLPATFVSLIEPDEMVAGMRLELPMEFEGPTTYRFAVYAGPLDFDPLKELDSRLGHNTTKLVDFGFKLIRPISLAVYWFLNKVHSVVPNYGLVIIILSILVRLIFHPLNVKSLESQQRLRAMQPELKEMNEKYKDNPEMRSKKMMELHRKHGVNPVGGCLPMLVQMPVLFALWPVLMNSIEMRKAPFVWWIQDLSAPDKVAEIAGFPINLLPILMAGTMLWQQKLTPTDPKQAPMMMLMPIMMIFFFYSMPSGLVLYWTVMNIMAIAQQMMMKPVVLATDEPTPKERKK